MILEKKSSKFDFVACESYMNMAKQTYMERELSRFSNSPVTNESNPKVTLKRSRIRSLHKRGITAK